MRVATRSSISHGMVGALPPRRQPDHGAPLRRDSGTLSPGGIDHVVDCLAGVYAHENLAREALQKLVSEQGLLPPQLAFLEPADAGWLRFRRLSRQWAHRGRLAGTAWLDDSVLVGTLGALVTMLLAALWLVLDGSLSLAQDGLTVVLAAAAGAALGAGLVALLERHQHQRRFDRSIRRQLRAGRWVVLTHNVATVRQAQVSAIVRERSTTWCAVSSSPRWL